ncbi:MAG: hypothetical protein P3W93_005100 [Thermus sp.]|nr:hypothetical protein [Thermus sp.]
MDHVVWLDGLKSDDFPLSALVAYGVLRVLSEERGLDRVRLVFKDARGRPVAGIQGVTEDELILHLEEHLRQVPPFPQGVSGDDLKEALSSFQSLAQGGDKRASIFFPALYLPQPNGYLYTPLDTTKGMQGLLKILRWAYEVALRFSLKEVLCQVLFSGVLVYPGAVLPKVRNYKDVYRIGWHASQYRQWAQRARKPNKEKAIETVRIHPVAILLAWEALPLFVLFPSVRGPMGAGIGGLNGDRPSLLLPIPETPVALEELRSLLFQSALFVMPSHSPWPSDVAIWLSERTESVGTDGRYPVFLDAYPLPRGSSFVAK